MGRVSVSLQLSKVFRLRSTVAQCFRDHYFSRGYVEVRGGTCVCVGGGSGPSV